MANAAACAGEPASNNIRGPNSVAESRSRHSAVNAEAEPAWSVQPVASDTAAAAGDGVILRFESLGNGGGIGVSVRRGADDGAFESGFAGDAVAATGGVGARGGHIHNTATSPA